MGRGLYHESDPTLRLSAEITDYVHYLTVELERRREARERIVERITRVCGTLWASSRVVVFGSCGTGLATLDSDLDVIVLHANACVANLTAMRTLGSALRAQAWLHSIKLVEGTTVPVIKLKCKDDKLPTDITLSEPLCPCAACKEASAQHSGLALKRVVLELTGRSAALRPLVLVLKQMLARRKLNNAYTGGLSSFCVVLMVAAYIHLHARARPHNLGTLLLGFLHFYANMDYSKQAIAFDRMVPHILPLACLPLPATFPLVIIDPTQDVPSSIVHAPCSLPPLRNLGRNAFAMWRVKQEFAHAHAEFTRQPLAGLASFIGPLPGIYTT
jgi:DNA polymerase sigma